MYRGFFYVLILENPEKIFAFRIVLQTYITYNKYNFICSNERGEMERLKAYRNIIQKLQWNTAIEDILIRKDFVDRKRVLLLQDIINAMEEKIPDLEEIRNKTFEYGGMIEKDDLLARHIFIVLQIYLRERTEPAGIYVMEMTEPVGVGRTGKRRFV